METVRRRAVEVEWDPDTRVAVVRFTEDTDATADDARAMIDALEQYIGTAGRPWGFLGDGTHLKLVNAEFRAVLAAFFRQHREDARMSLYDMNPILAIAVDMFAIGTGLRIRMNPDEAHARAWLREEGIDA